jgi:hypothetical protein
VPRSKAEHMAAPTNAAGVKKALANPEPSTHGPHKEQRGDSYAYRATEAFSLGPGCLLHDWFSQNGGAPANSLRRTAKTKCEPDHSFADKNRRCWLVITRRRRCSMAPALLSARCEPTLLSASDQLLTCSPS